MTDRIPLDHLTSDQLDALYDQLDTLREELAETRHLHQLQKRMTRHRRTELEHAEAALARVQALADEHPAGIDTALIHAALDHNQEQ